MGLRHCQSKTFFMLKGVMRAAITFIGKTCASHYSYQIVPSESFWGWRCKQLAEQLVFLGHVIVTLNAKSCNYTLVAIPGLVED